MIETAASSHIGVIAGGGQFPLLFIEAAKKAGRGVALVAHVGETPPETAALADLSCWVKLGQFGKMLDFFQTHGITETVLLGAITKTKIFTNVFPDLRGLALWNEMRVHQDDHILRAVARALAKEGITVRESTMYLQHLLFPTGVLGKKRPSSEQRDDIAFGFRKARAIGELDIGQCVVVRDRAVLAVEAIEGTDATIRRGGQLAKEKAVVIKVKKPGQDFRFDLPATGSSTIQTLAEVKGAVLAVEAGQSLIFDRDEMIAQADKAGIVLVGVEERADGSLNY
ncbi:MAG: UDP-2,3-diacylglucosamine diphosphatase LpxI [Desulfobulbaceae bacterium]|jgi:DUF1009 family protein|nr:UDP-2,3-diacylglucosamine diphosphatase LpxI [Desulfobulbaceae bacterium]